MTQMNVRDSFPQLLAWIGIFFVSLLYALSAWADNVTYTYDALNRLSRVQYADGTAIQYIYDAAGNRTSRVLSKPTQPLSPNTGPDQTVQKGDLTPSDFLPEEQDAADLVPR